MQIAQNKQSANQGKRNKNASYRAELAVTASGHHGQTVVTTTARGGSHGQAVVAATTVVAVPLPRSLRFFCGLSNSTPLCFGCCFFLALKWRVNLVHGIY